MKILLLMPSFQSASPSWSMHTIPFLRKRAFMVPLPLATVAGMTPAGAEVLLWDESVQGRVEEGLDPAETFDLVGVTGYDLHMARAREVARHFRDRGALVVGGGPGVSADPEHYRADFDVLFVGEAELTWPRFLDDLRAGRHASVYRETTLPEIRDVPEPRWANLTGLLAENYLLGAVQITRGCPYRCEFCDVWKVFGNGMRVKPVEKVLREVAEMVRLGMEDVFLISDNFVGDKRYSRELLRGLVELRPTLDRPPRFHTELTLNVARDEELLSLFAEAGFGSLFIGIESPNAASLKETRKRHNLFGDLVESCRLIHSYGLPIEASMIVGFDHDTPAIFEEQFRFLQEAAIPHPRMHMLKAIRGTDLWTRLVDAGRVVDLDRIYEGELFQGEYYPAQYAANILPAGMTRIELMEGYLGLLERLYGWEAFAARMKGFVSTVRRPPAPPREEPSAAARDGWNRFFGSLEPGIQATIGDLFAHAHRTSPTTSRLVAGKVLQQYLETQKLPHTRRILEEQIRFESAHDVRAYLAVRESLAPQH